MNRPLTDRERCLALEARVAELEELLAAYRANDREAADDDAMAMDIFRIARTLKPHIPGNQGAKGVARLLVYLLAHPGQLCRHHTLQMAVAGHDDGCANIVNVRVCQLRHALRAWGFAGAVVTVPRIGYLLERAFAAPLAERVGLAHV